jgi:hypothetical protein
MSSPALAGGAYRYAPRSATAAAPAASTAAPSTTRPVTITILPAAPQPANEPLVVSIRGPEGEVRRFPVEGGRAAIETYQVIVRSGASITIRWLAAK